MKPILLIAAITLPWAIAQENKPRPLHWFVEEVGITAASIHQDASAADNPHLPVMYLKGDVEIIKPSCRNASTSCYTKMVLRADEAEYHPDTGEIKPSGNVRVTFEELK